MAPTSQRRILAAKEFVRLGFGDAIDDQAPFFSHDFLTQELTTLEAQEVIPVVERFNAFHGVKVAKAIGRFRGRVSGWKFGSAGSPLLLVVLAPWTIHLEEKAGAKPSTKFSPAEVESLIAELRTMFLDELDADKFERDGTNDYVYGAWWD